MLIVYIVDLSIKIVYPTNLLYINYRKRATSLSPLQKLGIKTYNNRLTHLFLTKFFNDLQKNEGALSKLIGTLDYCPKIFWKQQIFSSPKILRDFWGFTPVYQHYSCLLNIRLAKRSIF